MTGNRPEVPSSFATEYPAACIDSADVHRVLGVPKRVAGRFITEGVLLEPLAVMDVALNIHESGKSKESFNRVAAVLIGHARSASGEEAASIVQDQMEGFFAERPKPLISKDEVLAEAKKILPARIYRQVEAAYSGLSESN